MTYSNRTWRLIQASLLIAVGCSSRVEVANPGTGGADSAGGARNSGGWTFDATGGSTPIGMQTGGWSPTTGTGGAWQGTGTGGATPTGGIAATGGNPWPATGGAWQGTSTGGNPWPATGGMPATGGAIWQGTGGAPWPGVCTTGADHTCNDDLSISTLMGHCEGDGSCTCGDRYVLNRNSGKCTTYDQTVCYSPTQNIDLAYVDRAFGCRCDPNTAVPFCGIDSNGLRVYLDCQASDQSWHSASTTYCNGATPATCFSPTRSIETALASNALGCSCYPTGSHQCVPLAPLQDAGTNDIFGADAGSPTSVDMVCTAGRWEASLSNDCR